MKPSELLPRWNVASAKALPAKDSREDLLDAESRRAQSEYIKVKK
ncbi:hypothetical protein [Thermofilum sp.]